MNDKKIAELREKFANMLPEDRIAFWERLEDLGRWVHQYEKARVDLILAARRWRDARKPDGDGAADAAATKELRRITAVVLYDCVTMFEEIEDAKL